MKRTCFLLMSMAIVCVMTLTSCNEIISSIDNPVSSYVQFAKSELIMQPGTQVQNAATTISTEKIIYTTSDATVVTVDQNGTITAVADGEATITASVPGNEYYTAGSATCLVKVANPLLSTPLTLEALTAGTIQVSSPKIGMQYSLDGGTTKNDVLYPFSINVTKGDKVAFYGTANSYLRTKFDGTADVKVYGNIMSLVDETGFAENKTLTADEAFRALFQYNTHLKDASDLLLPATTLTQRCYQNMFRGCTSLTKAPKLPATTLADYCYASMFRGCTNLTKAPELPVTTLADYCYAYMFYKCTSLTKAPELPATTLKDYCYWSMFQDCTSLTNAPELKATTLAFNCYNYMFDHCTSLIIAPELPATELKGSCYNSMFSGCTSLTKAPELPATTLADYCYCGMFSYCTSLTNAPELKTTDLKQGCYQNMFRGCTSLTKAPELPATTLKDYCYWFMFSGCTSLNAVTCLATDISATDCITDWLSGVAASGTFTRAGTTAWPDGASGKPTGWSFSE